MVSRQGAQDLLFLGVNADDGVLIRLHKQPQQHGDNAKLLAAVSAGAGGEVLRGFPFAIPLTVQHPLETAVRDAYVVSLKQMQRDVAGSQMRPFDGFISGAARRVLLHKGQYPNRQLGEGNLFFFRPPPATRWRS